MFTDVSVDLETLATTADAAFISIGAVKFNLINDEVDSTGFYASVSLQSNLDYHRVVSEDTLKWWLGQSNDAQKVFHEPKQGIDDALESFTDWFWDHSKDPAVQGNLTKERRVWCNGANFDEPILAHALTQCRLDIPWKFWNVRCVRTYKNLPGAKNLVIPRVGTHHNALGDALTQARLVRLVHKTLFERESNGRHSSARRADD